MTQRRRPRDDGVSDAVRRRVSDMFLPEEVSEAISLLPDPVSAHQPAERYEAMLMMALDVSRGDIRRARVLKERCARNPNYVLALHLYWGVEDEDAIVPVIDEMPPWPPRLLPRQLPDDLLARARRTIMTHCLLCGALITELEAVGPGVSRHWIRQNPVTTNPMARGGPGVIVHAACEPTARRMAAEQALTWEPLPDHHR